MARVIDLGLGELSPMEWGARRNYDTWRDPDRPKDKVIGHWPGSKASSLLVPTTAAERSALRSFENHHIGKGWRGLAYGYAIGLTGTVYRARGMNDYGAHLGDLDDDGISENREGIPVLVMYHLNGAPSVAQMEKLLVVRARLQDRLGVRLPLYGHREVDELGDGTSTDCPGPLIGFIRANRTPPTDPNTRPPTGEEIDMQELAELTKRVDDLSKGLAAEISRSANNRALAQLNRDKMNRAAQALGQAGEAISEALTALREAIEAFDDDPADPSDD